MTGLTICPFCGCSMSVRSNRDWHRIVGDHDEQCVFMEAETMMVPASDEQLAIAVTDWNRRAQDFDAMRKRAETAEREVKELEAAERILTERCKRIGISADLVREVRQRCPLPDWARSRIDAALAKQANP